MDLLTTVVSMPIQLRYQLIKRWLNEPIKTQEKLLFGLIKEAQKTAFGKVHQFNSIHTVADFKSKVPLHQYEDLKPYIDEMLEGKKDILWPGLVKWFSKSSGTTAKSKYIPVSDEALKECNFKAGRDMLSLYFEMNPDSKLFSGRGLSLGGSQEVLNIDKEIRVGDVSAIMLHNLPIIYKLYNTPDIETNLLPDFEEKIERIAQDAIERKITHIVGVPTWTLVLFKRVLEITGKPNISAVWPDLEMYAHGGVNFDPYEEEFRRLIPSEKMHYYNVYNASEGVIAGQYSKESKDMLMLLDNGIFFEFLPLVDFGKKDAKTYQLNEVEEGEIYVLVMSTNAGLWRYVIGDTIRFTSINPPLIEIVGRTKHFINAFGEELMVHNTDQALRKVCKQLNCKIQDYTAAPIYFSNQQKGTHEWIIEFIQTPKNQEEFIQKLDAALRSLNSDYDAKRHKDLALSMPKVHFVPIGTFYKWMGNRGKLGGQNKVPRLSNNRNYVDEILALIN